MTKTISDFKIILEAPESNLIINDLDMEFIVKKSVRTDADTAYITIWNLDETSYKLLILREQVFYLYTQYGQNDAELLFTGYSDKNFITRKRVEIIQKNNEPALPDIKTCIKLIESKKAYQNTFINESYREDVSAEQIIQDCISAMGLGCVMLNTTIPEKTYHSFKAIGKPHQILFSICEALGLNVVIQNGVINIGTPSLNNTEQDVQVFNRENCLEPQYQGSDEMLLITGLRPDIYPNNIIKCEFDEFDNIFRVIDVTFEGNNFDKVSTTHITIGIQNND